MVRRHVRSPTRCPFSRDVVVPQQQAQVVPRDPVVHRVYGSVDRVSVYFAPSARLLKRSAEEKRRPPQVVTADEEEDSRLMMPPPPVPPPIHSRIMADKKKDVIFRILKGKETAGEEDPALISLGK
jgi:hypothetical protein